MTEGQFDTRSLLRLGLWGATATAALTVAVLAAHSSTGSQRIAFAMANVSGQASAQLRTPATDQLAARSAASEAETRRLAELVRALSTDRDRLQTRIASLERNIEDVTGSIRRQAAAAPATTSAAATTPATTAAATAPETTPPRQQLPPTTDATAATPAQTSAHVAAVPPAGEQPETVQPMPEFGIEIGGAINFDGLRTLWNSTRNANAALFEGLRPVVFARENRTRGTDLRLVAGPFANAEAAAAACATLTAARRYCQPAPFEGAQMSLIAPAVQPAAAVTTTPTTTTAPKATAPKAAAPKTAPATQVRPPVRTNP
jgi:hypothetical protein